MSTPVVQLTRLVGMPELPEGWYYETPESFPDLVYIVWPEHGAMTVSLKFHTLGTGWGDPGRNTQHWEAATGRGWKEKMIAKAIAHLKDVWEK